MGNTFINIPVPAGNGSGAATDVSTIGFLKTISMAGPFVASINIEISNESVATKWAPLATFNNPDGEVIEVACKWMRATVSGYVSGAPQCDVGGPTDTALLASLPVPANNGSGAAVDTSALGILKTVTVGGSFLGSVQIEVSEDGNTKWSQVGLGFQQPGQSSEYVTAKWMRVTRYGIPPQVSPGTPIVDVAALDASGGGAGGIAVEDEGTPLAGNPQTTINFVGAGVTATEVAGVATVTIPGVPASVDHIDLSDGTGVAVAPAGLARLRQIAGVLQVSYNGGAYVNIVTL